MDLLIIKKQKDEIIDNDIARIFRKYNVIEYKSPDDALTIDDFYKTVGYACIYKAMAQTVNEIPADIDSFFHQAEKQKQQGDKLNINAILEVSYSANKEIFDEIKRRNQSMSDILKSLMKDELEAAALETSREMAIRMNKIGISLEDIAKVAGVPMDTVKKWLGKQTA